MKHKADVRVWHGAKHRPDTVIRYYKTGATPPLALLHRHERDGYTLDKTELGRGITRYTWRLGIGGGQ